VKRNGRFETENMLLWSKIVSWKKPRKWLELNDVDFKDWERELIYQESLRMLMARHQRLSFIEILEKMKAM
jgi:hypothetical protein